MALRLLGEQPDKLAQCTDPGKVGEEIIRMRGPMTIRRIRNFLHRHHHPLAGIPGARLRFAIELRRDVDWVKQSRYRLYFIRGEYNRG